MLEEQEKNLQRAAGDSRIFLLIRNVEIKPFMNPPPQRNHVSMTQRAPGRCGPMFNIFEGKHYQKDFFLGV